jgi:hypothetical protein
VFGLLLVWLTYRVLPEAVRQLSGALARSSPERVRPEARESA